MKTCLAAIAASLVTSLAVVPSAFAQTVCKTALQSLIDAKLTVEKASTMAMANAAGEAVTKASALVTSECKASERSPVPEPNDTPSSPSSPTPAPAAPPESKGFFASIKSFFAMDDVPMGVLCTRALAGDRGVVTSQLDKRGVTPADCEPFRSAALQLAANRQAQQRARIENEEREMRRRLYEAQIQAYQAQAQAAQYQSQLPRGGTINCQTNGQYTTCNY